MLAPHPWTSTTQCQSVLIFAVAQDPYSLGKLTTVRASKVCNVSISFLFFLNKVNWGENG